MERAQRERIGAATATMLAHASIAAALLWGLGIPLPAPLEDPLRVFHVAPPAPIPTPRNVTVRIREAAGSDGRPGREGAASPPNLRSQATEIVAPPPVLTIPVPPVVAASVAGHGSDTSIGAAEIRGPGTGAGGRGPGRGSGSGGAGDGGGGGRETPPRLIRGTLRDSDYPAGLGEAGIDGLVSIRFTVALDGSATNCRITRSSGSERLDATTCRLVERRYRFEPSRDARGRPVLADIVEDHHWIVEDLTTQLQDGRALD